MGDAGGIGRPRRLPCGYGPSGRHGLPPQRCLGICAICGVVTIPPPLKYVAPQLFRHPPYSQAELIGVNELCSPNRASWRSPLATLVPALSNASTPPWIIDLGWLLQECGRTNRAEPFAPEFTSGKKALHFADTDIARYSIKMEKSLPIVTANETY